MLFVRKIESPVRSLHWIIMMLVSFCYSWSLIMEEHTIRPTRRAICLLLLSASICYYHLQFEESLLYFLYYCFLSIVLAAPSYLANCLSPHMHIHQDIRCLAFALLQWVGHNHITSLHITSIAVVHHVTKVPPDDNVTAVMMFGNYGSPK